MSVQKLAVLEFTSVPVASVGSPVGVDDDPGRSLSVRVSPIFSQLADLSVYTFGHFCRWFDAHVRQRAYWDVFSGAFGHTYGDHSVWQMYAPQRKPVNGPLLYWNEAIHRPGAAEMQWVVEGYALFLAALILLGGSLGDLYGRKRMFLAGIVLFTAASAVCAAAPNVSVLILARCVQGIGAACAMPE